MTWDNFSGVLIILTLTCFVFYKYIQSCKVRSTCVFCHKGEEDGPLNRASKTWAYESISYVYHDRCYKHVIKNPKIYDTRVVDEALEIDEILSYWSRRRKEEEGERQRRLSEADQRIKYKWVK